jgi:excisionase family DNA binding protein
MPPVRHLTSEELADRLRVSRQTLAEWRRDKRGPAYIADGGKFVRYRLTEVEAWEKRALVATT